MARPRGPRSLAPVSTLLSASPAQLARMSPEERAQLLKRMKGQMPPNGSAPPAGGAPPTNTIFS